MQVLTAEAEPSRRPLGTQTNSPDKGRPATPAAKVAPQSPGKAQRATGRGGKTAVVPGPARKESNDAGSPASPAIKTCSQLEVCLAGIHALHVLHR